MGKEEQGTSQSIDDEIKAGKTVPKTRKKPVKVFLLGQSESGTSSVLVFCFVRDDC